MSREWLAFTPALELAFLLRTRKLSPVEAVDHLLQRIGQLNPRLNAYLTVAEEKARDAARAAEVGQPQELPPLWGVPISVKDLIFTRGLRTTGGSLVYEGFIPEEDAVVVERLRRAGAIILGKTNTSEFGQSTTTENRLGEDCRNPWDLGHTSGGSSGGAAASVAAGLGAVAIGSDGGGSIRIPAAFCGVFGFKPSFGLVPTAGHFGGMPLFAVIGPITRTVADAALALQVMAGYDPRDHLSLKAPPPDLLAGLKGEVRGLRVGWSPDLGYARVDPEVRSVVSSCLPMLESLGLRVEPAPLTLTDPAPIFGPIVLADTYAAYGHLLEKEAGALMPYVRATLERGREVTGAAYSQALRGLEALRRQMADFFEGYDLLVTPTTAVPAFPLRQRPQEIDGQKVSTLWGPFPFTMVFNLTGQPAATLPCGFSAQGLPIGLQLVGRYREDLTVLRVAAAFEQARPWADKLPAL